MKNQITLPITELKQALSGLGKVISRKTTLPVLQTVKLSRNGDGKVSLSATDLDTFVTYNVLLAQSGEVVDVLLPFEQLNKSVKGSSGEVVIIPETKDRVKLRYQVGNSPLEQSVNTIPIADFPPIPKITTPAIKMPENFGEVLRQAFEISSTDSSRYVLQGAYLDVEEPKCHSIISTNGRALFAANTFKFDLKESVNISKQKFLAWSGFLEGECLLAVQPNKSATGYVQFTTPRWNCIVKQIDGAFPKWRQVVPIDTDTWTKVQLSKAAIEQILNLSSKLPGDDNPDRPLRLGIEKEVYLEGKNKDDKEFTSAVIGEVKIIGKAVMTCLNREYLQTALRCGLDEIRINNSLDPIVFSNLGKRMVVMPVRTTAAPVKPVPPQSTPTPQPTPKPEAEAKPERKHMPRKAPEAPAPTTTESSFSKLLTQVDQIRDNLKNAVRDLNLVGDLLKGAEKEKKTTEKEIEIIRSKLRKIQNVTI